MSLVRNASGLFKQYNTGAGFFYSVNCLTRALWSSFYSQPGMSFSSVDIVDESHSILSPLQKHKADNNIRMIASNQVGYHKL